MLENRLTLVISLKAMELNKEIEVFTEEKSEDLPAEPKPVEQPPPPPEKIQTPPKPVEKSLVTSNEVAVVNSNTDLVWSKEKTGPERVSIAHHTHNKHSLILLIPPT